MCTKQVFATFGSLSCTLIGLNAFHSVNDCYWHILLSQSTAECPASCPLWNYRETDVSQSFGQNCSLFGIIQKLHFVWNKHKVQCCPKMSHLALKRSTIYGAYIPASFVINPIWPLKFQMSNVSVMQNSIISSVNITLFIHTVCQPKLLSRNTLFLSSFHMRSCMVSGFIHSACVMCMFLLRISVYLQGNILLFLSQSLYFFGLHTRWCELKIFRVPSSIT